MPKHVLHIAPASAPCRAVLLHHALLGAQAPELQIEVVDLQQGQHKAPPFIEINPRHCVPTLQTPYGPLCESRAIMIYLADLAQQADPNGWTCYPRTVYHRARVHELLDWDQGSFYKAVGEAVYPKAFRNEEPTHEQLDALKNVFSHLDQHLLGGDAAFLTGDMPTIADISVAMGATMLRLANLEVADMPNVEAWQEKMSRLQGWAEVNGAFEQWVASMTEPADAPAEASSAVPAQPAAEAPSPAS